MSTRLMSRLVIGLVLIIAASCATKKVGGGKPPIDPIPEISLSPAMPASGYLAGTAVTLNVRLQGAQNPPYNFSVTFNEGVTPQTHSFALTSGLNGNAAGSLSFTIDKFCQSDFPAGKVIAFFLSGTDGYGSVGNLSASFNAVGIPDCDFGSISTAFNPEDCSVTVTTFGESDAHLTVTPTTVPGSLTTPPPQEAVGTGTLTSFFTPQTYSRVEVVT